MNDNQLPSNEFNVQNMLIKIMNEINKKDELAKAWETRARELESHLSKPKIIPKETDFISLNTGSHFSFLEAKQFLYKLHSARIRMLEIVNERPNKRLGIACSSDALALEYQSLMSYTGTYYEIIDASLLTMLEYEKNVKEHERLEKQWNSERKDLINQLLNTKKEIHISPEYVKELEDDNNRLSGKDILEFAIKHNLKFADPNDLPID